MGTTVESASASHIRFGVARADITPPDGIYHPMWGAARHQRATGVHRKLYADVVAISSCADAEIRFIQAQLDMVGLAKEQHDDLVHALSTAAKIPAKSIVLAYSHTHAGGLFTPDRIDLPGGELIEPYLVEVRAALQAAVGNAVANMQNAYVTYAKGQCNMATNRDYWDGDRGIFTCGYNPDVVADDTLLVARVTNSDGQALAVIVNYACHPTTLAWENTLISPDYVGALRHTIELHVGAPCVFTLGACGDLGPRRNYAADPQVADANGRQLAFATLSALEAMDPPASNFTYQGPVVSGATLGTWAATPFTPEQVSAAGLFDGGQYVVDLPLKPRPDRSAIEDEMDDYLARRNAALGEGNELAAREFGALAERSRRWLLRLANLPSGATYPFHYAVYRLGDAIWVSVGGEPYNILQRELRRRFPDCALIVTAMAGELGVAYLLPKDRYGKGLYQEEPSILAEGCLETLIQSIAERISPMLNGNARPGA